MINIEELIKECEIECHSEFSKIDDIALNNQKKVLDAFKSNRVSANHFYGSTGYGYDDLGRNTLNYLFKDVFHTEDAIVSPLIANGTHALTLALFGLLRPNDKFLSISGAPYDTLLDVINGKDNGSLKDYNISFNQIDLLENGEFDLENIRKEITNNKYKLIFIQRSKGYLWRDALSVKKIGEIVKFIRNINKNTIIMVDNCYGEFVDYEEPTDVGADICIGSLIKNIGGGIAPTGGYIVGKKALIEQVSYRLTAPSLGLEVGSYIPGYLYFYEGLFLAPSIVKNALKGSILIGHVLNKFNIESMPKIGVQPNDIIKSIKFNTADELIKFCQLIQSLSPVDSYVTPEPWDMPGYNDQVIMAAGTFIQGASLELTADGSVSEPYVAYLQGGLTYEHCKLACIEIAKYLNERYS